MSTDALTAIRNKGFFRADLYIRRLGQINANCGNTLRGRCSSDDRVRRPSSWQPAPYSGGDPNMSKTMQNVTPIVALMVLLASVWLGAFPARAQSAGDPPRAASGEVMWSNCTPDQTRPNRGTCDGPNGPTQVACLKVESLGSDGTCRGNPVARMMGSGCLMGELPMSDGSCGVGASVGCNTGDEMVNDGSLPHYCYRTAGQQPQYGPCDPLVVDVYGNSRVTGAPCRYVPAFEWRTTGYLPYQAREISWMMLAKRMHANIDDW